MTQEEKELLLKDLCARLPYGVICNDNRHGSSRVTNIDITPDDIEHKNPKVVLYYFDFDECGGPNNCKPYLRPMSSMTEEEKRQYMGFIAYSGNPNGSANFVDWLNEHHFDYRTTYDESKYKWVSMIEKGLAIAVTEENNPYKD